jgi:hypothetical protein
MKPKEKAKELINKYLEVNQQGIWNGTDVAVKLNKRLSKQCALISVDELIYETQFEVPNIRQRYWKDVKLEIVLL